eukprot:6004732-Pyramimonas_sp.AAC.2
MACWRCSCLPSPTPASSGKFTQRSPRFTKRASVHPALASIHPTPASIRLARVERLSPWGGISSHPTHSPRSTLYRCDGLGLDTDICHP